MTGGPLQFKRLRTTKENQSKVGDWNRNLRVNGYDLSSTRVREETLPGTWVALPELISEGGARNCSW